MTVDRISYRCRSSPGCGIYAGFYGSLPQKNAIWLLKKGFYDYAGTDIHSLDYRPIYESLSLKGDLHEAVKLLIRQNGELWKV